ncbi:MAG TPA: DUF2249 domain-containing protein [Jatrophihabitantaceae bacterium]|jgi:uncharacterized protein (DUF2249 family)
MTEPRSEELVSRRGTLDVRTVPKPRRHPLVFARFDALAAGESFVLVNSHDPKHLRDEFDRDHPGAFEWTYLPSDDKRGWRIRITRRTEADLPRVLTDTAGLIDSRPDARGAVWRLDITRRHLDANVIRLGPEERIDAHLGPDLDVLLHILDGAGQILTSGESIPIHAGALVWLPRRSRRAVLAGSQGLTYLSVHPRRPGLNIATPEQ